MSGRSDEDEEENDEKQMKLVDWHQLYHRIKVGCDTRCGVAVSGCGGRRFSRADTASKWWVGHTGAA